MFERQHAVIQECKALNGRLINFLKERSTVEKLLQYLIQSPGAEEGSDQKQQFKYSFAACEVRRARHQCQDIDIQGVGLLQEIGQDVRCVI